MWWLLLLAAFFSLLVIAVLIFFWPDKVEDPPQKGDRLRAVGDFYSLQLELPTLSCIGTCTSDCAAVLDPGCQVLSRSTVDELGLERLIAYRGFVRRNAVPLPRATVYLGQERFSLRGRYWLPSPTITALEAGRQQQLAYRPNSAVVPQGWIGLYSINSIFGIESIPSQAWQEVAARFGLYLHEPGTELMVPSFWTTLWVIYRPA